MLAFKRLCSVLPRTASASKGSMFGTISVAVGRTISWTGAAAANTYWEFMETHN